MLLLKHWQYIRKMSALQTLEICIVPTSIVFIFIHIEYMSRVEYGMSELKSVCEGSVVKFVGEGRRGE